MPVDIDDVFTRGGKELIDLLDHGVRAVLPDLLFRFLVHEYRQFPTAPKAVAIYDAFCVPHASARISTTECLPPLNTHLEASMRVLRLNLAEQQAARSNGSPVLPMRFPPKYLFDDIDGQLRKKSRGLRSLRRRYQPQRTPVENLPRGRMNAGQRFFVDNIWEPRLRPMLVAAGFRRVASIA